MQPVMLTVNSTGLGGPVQLDYMQTPFSVVVSANPSTATAAFTIEHTNDFSSVFMNPTWNGTTAVWFTSAILTALTEMTFSSPVAAVRIQAFTATATSSITAWVAQASMAP